MEKELSTLDQYLTDPEWASRKLKELTIGKSEEIF